MKSKTPVIPEEGGNKDRSMLFKISNWRHKVKVYRYKMG